MKDGVKFWLPKPSKHSILQPFYIYILLPKEMYFPFFTIEAEITPPIFSEWTYNFRHSKVLFIWTLTSETKVLIIHLS